MYSGLSQYSFCHKFVSLCTRQIHYICFMNYPKSNADKVTHCKHSFQNEYNSKILLKENKVPTLKGRYTLGDKLQQQVMATDHSISTGLATSCCNMLWQHIMETNHFVCTGEILWKNLSLQQNFVAATSHTNSVWFDFLQHVAATKFCCRAKIFTKILQYTRSDLLLRRAVATCCCNVSPSVYRP